MRKTQSNVHAADAFEHTGTAVGSPLLAVIHDQLPSVSSPHDVKLARIVDSLVEEFGPERIYAYGSHARGDARPDSKVDLLVVVPVLSVPPYDLTRRALDRIGWQGLAADVIFIDRKRFDERATVVMSLPAIALREGKVLYAAERAAAA